MKEGKFGEVGGRWKVNTIGLHHLGDRSRGPHRKETKFSQKKSLLANGPHRGNDQKANQKKRILGTSLTRDVSVVLKGKCGVEKNCGVYHKKSMKAD